MMQTYTKVYHKRFPLWKKANRKLGKEAKIIYFYLLTSPFTHHSGLFEYNETMLINTGLTIKEIEKGVSELLANGLITVDEQLEYCLIAYLVENIKLDNKNMAKSLINYILDLEKTFLIGDFHKLIENTDVFNRLETVDEQLLNSYLTLSKQFANKDYTIKTIDNRLNTKDDKLKKIDNTIKIKENKLEKKEEKENKALLEKDALDIYNFYRQTIKPGNRKKTIENLIKFLSKHSKQDLIKSISNYSSYKKTEGTTELKFIKAPENFFSQASEIFVDYLPVNYLDPNMQKEIEELKQQSWFYNDGKFSELGLEKEREIKEKYGIKSEDFINVEFEVV